jgi:hypothetical protein
MKSKDVISKTLFFLNPEPTRGMMKFVKVQISGKLTQVFGVEIGVAEGYHAFKCLKTIPDITHLTLVDPYQKYISDGCALDYSSVEKEMLKRLKPFSNVTFLKETSEIASKRFPNNFFYYVYIDANHDYEHTLQDITLWYPKVKKGGVIGGHDFSGHYPGVAKAVIEFAEKNNLKIYGQGADWWYQK